MKLPAVLHMVRMVNYEIPNVQYCGWRIKMQRQMPLLRIAYDPADGTVRY